MTLGLLEAAVVALDTYLEANMAAKVVTLNARYADANVLVDIKRWYKGNMPLSTPESPSVILHGADFTVANAMQKPTNLQVRNLLNVFAFYGSDDVEKRFAFLCRYALGLIELMNAGQDAMGYTFKIAGPVSLTEAMAPPDFLQGVQIPVTFEKNETF